MCEGQVLYGFGHLSLAQGGTGYAVMLIYLLPEDR